MKKIFIFAANEKDTREKTPHFVRWNKLFFISLEKFENKKWKLIKNIPLENEDMIASTNFI